VAPPGRKAGQKDLTMIAIPSRDDCKLLHLGHGACRGFRSGPGFAGGTPGQPVAVLPRPVGRSICRGSWASA
jgi:hypothetical protein